MFPTEFEAVESLRVVDPTRRRDRRTDVEATTFVAAGERQVAEATRLRSILEGQVTAPQGFDGLERAAVGVGVAHHPTLDPQPGAGAPTLREIALPRAIGGERTGAVVGDQPPIDLSTVQIQLVVALIDLRGIHAGHPVGGAGGTQPQILRNGAMTAQKTRREVVPGICAPITVEGVDDVRIGDRRHAAHYECVLPLQRERQPARELSVAPWLIGAGDARIIEGKGVETVVLFDPQRRHIGCPSRGGRERGAQPQGPLIESVGIVATERLVASRTVAAMTLHDRTPGAFFPSPATGEPATRDETEGDRRGFTHRRFKTQQRLGTWRGGGEVDESGERVGAESGPLRSTQHLHLAEVEQRGRHPDPGEIHTVNQEPDRRVGGALPLIGLADAPQLEVTRTRGPRGPIEVRHQSEHILQVLYARATQRRRVEHRGADRGLDERCRTQPRRDHDLLERVG